MAHLNDVHMMCMYKINVCTHIPTMSDITATIHAYVDHCHYTYVDHLEYMCEKGEFPLYTAVLP